MARKNRCGSIIAALGMFASILAVGHEAQAAGSKLTVSKGGIVVVGGGGAGTDPPYTYQFDVSLTGTLNKYSVFTTPTSITFQNLVGVAPAYLFLDAAPPTEPSSGWVPTITLDSFNFQTDLFTSDVTFTYFGSTSVTSPGNGTSPLDLGVFTVTTASNVPGGYAPGILPTSLPYGYSIDGGAGAAGGGSGTNLTTPTLEVGGIGAVAPEPATLIAPLLFMLGLPLVTLLKRHRSTSSPQTA